MSESQQAYVSEEEVSRRLQVIEEKHDLLRFEMDDWCVWPLFRFEVSRRLQKVPIDKAHASRFARSELVRIALGDILGMLRARRAGVVAFSHCSSHSEIRCGLKVDVYLDDVLRALGSAHKIEVLDSHEAYFDGRRQLVPRLMTTVAANLVAAKGTRRPTAEMMRMGTAIGSALYEECGVAVLGPDEIAERLASFRAYRMAYKTLLKRLRPECVLMVATDYYTTAAARELGVDVVELQHGFTHRHFPGTSWTRYALPYKSRMALPTRLFLYGPYWQRELKANGFWSDEVRVVGSARIDSYRERPRKRSPDVFTLVVTTQGTDTERLIAFMRELTLLAAGKGPLRVVFKMHPVCDQQIALFKATFDGMPSVQVVSASEAPATFELLMQADMHASIYSTCHYEALALGVPTAILPLTGAENVLDLYRVGHAHFPQSPQELLEIVDRQRGRTLRPEVGSEYFTPGAVGNMIRELHLLRRAGA